MYDYDLARFTVAVSETAMPRAAGWRLRLFFQIFCPIFGCVHSAARKRL